MAKISSLIKTGAALGVALSLLVNCSSSNEPSREDRVAEALEQFEVAIDKAKATNGPGVPAMWKLADEDTSIHIFGTVHVLKPEIEWRTDTFNDVFNSAEKLVFEIDLHSPEGQQAIGKAMLSAGMWQDGQTLTGVLSEEDLAIVKEAVNELGVPMNSLDPVEPWFAALNLANAQWMKDGFDPNSGVEMVLVKEAKTQNKSFGFLETAEQQTSVFDDLAMETQIGMLVETAMTLEFSGPMLDTLTEEWADGDVEGLGIIAANPDMPGDREFYDALFLERNTNWVPQIEAMLDEPGSVLIAVGAGHLAGPDSVITMLESKGHTLTRVQ